MPLATIRPMGESGLYHIHFLDAGRPDNSLPGGAGQPGHDLPWQPGHPEHGLPGGGHVSNRPPGSGGSGIPDNELPDTPPPHLLPGYTLVMVRGSDMRWHYAAIDPGQPPPKPLPGPPPHVGGGPMPNPPGGSISNPIAPGGEYPSTGPVPPTGAPPVAGQPLPPTAAPKPGQPMPQQRR